MGGKCGGCEEAGQHSGSFHSGAPSHPTQPLPRSPPSFTLTFKCVECEIAWSEKTEDGMYWQPLETAMNFTNDFLESSCFTFTNQAHNSPHLHLRRWKWPASYFSQGSPSQAQCCSSSMEDSERTLASQIASNCRGETFACHVRVERTWVFLLERTRERHTSLRRQESAAPPCPKS